MKYLHESAGGGVKWLDAVVCVLVALTSFELSEARAQESIMRYSYDSQARLISSVVGEECGIQYSYDASGNRVRRICVTSDDPKADHDGNGLFDLWELSHIGRLGALLPGADEDGDARSNLFECKAWTDPFDPTSYLKTGQTLDLEGGQRVFRLEWNAHPYVLYRVWWCEDLMNWNLANSLVTCDGVVIDSALEGVPRRFYRVSVED